MPTSFVKRQIELSIRLAPNTGTSQPNTFAESGTDTVNIKGLRASVQVQNSGSPANCTANIKVYGMSPSLMNQLTTLGLVLNVVPRNTLTISAGDGTPGGMSVVFSGTIYASYADYSSLPDVPFHFSAILGASDSVVPAPASSFTGPTSVVTILQGLARQMGMGFENNGVDVQLSSPYFKGALMVQAKQCVEHAGIDMAIIRGNVMAIWPRGKNRATTDIPVISRERGMIGYPAFTQQGVIVSTLFDPRISQGSLIKIDSSLFQQISALVNRQQPLAKNAAVPNVGTFPTTWAVNKLDLALDAQVPNGEWRSTVYAYNPNFSKGILPPATGSR